MSRFLKFFQKNSNKCEHDSNECEHDWVMDEPDIESGFVGICVIKEWIGPIYDTCTKCGKRRPPSWMWSSLWISRRWWTRSHCQQCETYPHKNMQKVWNIPLWSSQIIGSFNYNYIYHKTLIFHLKILL